MRLLSIYVAANEIRSWPWVLAAAHRWAEPPAPGRETILCGDWTGHELRHASLFLSTGCEVSENAVGVRVASFLYLPTFCTTSQFSSQSLGFLIFSQGLGFLVWEKYQLLSKESMSTTASQTFPVQYDLETLVVRQKSINRLNNPDFSTFACLLREMKLKMCIFFSSHFLWNAALFLAFLPCPHRSSGKETKGVP